MPTITLRPVLPSDLETLYLYQLDPHANHMAAFVGQEPRDRPAFQAHWDKILTSAQNTNRTILAGGQIAGHIACYPSEGHLEVTYWLGKDFWGQGIATESLRQMLALVRHRPLIGRAAADNTGSIRVSRNAASKSSARTAASPPAAAKKSKNKSSASTPTNNRNASLPLSGIRYSLPSRLHHREHREHGVKIPGSTSVPPKRTFSSSPN